MSRDVDINEPAAIARATFSTSFRGFDQRQVRVFLQEVAKQLDPVLADLGSLQAEVDRLGVDLERAETFDDERIGEILGAETTKILDAAREAAEERLAEAERDAAAIVAQGELDAAERQEAAEQLLADAESVGARRADEVVAAAREDLEATRGDAQSLIDEAELVRRRILGDLGRRRELYRYQVEQLRLGRERLLEGLERLRETLDASTSDLTLSLAEARAVAASLPAPDAVDEVTMVEHLEDQIEAARLVGHPIIEIDDESDAVDVFLDADTDSPAIVDFDSLEGEQTVVDDEPASVVLADVVEPETGIFKAKRPQEFDRLPREEVPVVRPPDELEEVRLLVDATDAEEVADASEPGRAGGELIEAPSDAHQFVGSIKPEPEPEPEREREPEPEPESPEPVPAEPEPESPEPVPAEPEPESPEPVPAEPAPESEPAPELESDEEPTEGAVDDLFARLRAERAEAVEHARAVLEPDAAPELTPTTMPETAPSLELTPADTAPEIDAEPPSDPTSRDDDQLDTPTLIARRSELTAVAEKSLARIVKRLLADEQSELLEHVRQTKAQLDLSEAYPELDRHVARYAEAASAELAGVAAAAATDLVESSSAAPGPTDLLDEATTFASAFLEPLRHHVGEALRGAAGDEQELTRRIRAHYRETKTQRVGRAMGDALDAACNQGIARALDPGTPVRWIVDPDNVCGPDCADNALATDVVFGEPFPTGVIHPPGHLGCRCLLATGGS